MLSIHKNKLINRLLQLEIAFNEVITETVEKIEGSSPNLIQSSNIISRNIQSIKKQINKL